jgi:hypothetical protein
VTSIVIRHEVVVIETYSEGRNLPQLNGGEIGDHSNILPKSVKIDVPTGLTTEELITFSHPLIIGNTLTNCEEWRNKLIFTSNSFRSECVWGIGGDQRGG